MTVIDHVVHTTIAEYNELLYLRQESDRTSFPHIVRTRSDIQHVRTSIVEYNDLLYCYPLYSYLLYCKLLYSRQEVVRTRQG